MPERKTLNKRDMVFAHYTKLYGVSHVLSKLGEESAELIQVIFKLTDKQHHKLPIPKDLVDHFWEEMAHVILFWGMASDALSTGGNLEEPVRERLNRLINKITAKMETSKYPARVILMEKERAPSPLVMPYATNEQGEVVCYLSQAQYSEQMENPNATWVAVNGEPAWFDDAYWESQLPNR